MTGRGDRQPRLPGGIQVAAVETDAHNSRNVDKSERHAAQAEPFAIQASRSVPLLALRAIIPTGRNDPLSALARGPGVGGAGTGKAPPRAGLFCLVPGSSCRALNRGFALLFIKLLPIEIDRVSNTDLCVPVPADGHCLLHDPGFLVVDVFE